VLQRLQRYQAELAAARGRVNALDPQRVLQRGYAWVEDGDGQPVLSAHRLRLSETVRAVWADGSAQAQITSVEPLPPSR
jgi:exodeoxyribonuclease VII large subunit